MESTSFNLEALSQRSNMQLNQITSLAFFVVSTLLLARATATAADGYLEKKITVRGTNIDRFPNFVEIITSDPRGEAAELFAAGGRNLSEHSLAKNRFTVFHHEVIHIFHTIDDYENLLRGHSFKDGDVVYKYWLDSEADAEKFAKRYNLQVVTRDTRLGNLPIVLYSTAPGFYVIASGKRAGIASTDGSKSDRPIRESDLLNWLRTQACPHCGESIGDGPCDISRTSGPRFRLPPPRPTCWRTTCRNCEQEIVVCARNTDAWFLD
jgi:hypothetical protein